MTRVASRSQAGAEQALARLGGAAAAESPKALIESAAGSKLTPAAPGWAAVEGAGILEEFFGKVSAGGDVADLAAEYDETLNDLLN